MPINPIADANKGEALDFIFEQILKLGFGTLNKTELDTIFFAAIMKYSDENNLTDYKLGMSLQITQQRVRSLKEKVSVKYCRITPAEAINSFIEKLGYAKIDGIYVDIQVNDVAMKNYFEDVLEEENILLHKQLNSKIFRLRIDDLLELMIALEIRTPGHQGITAEMLKENIVANLKDSQKKLTANLGEINDFEDFKKISILVGAEKILDILFKAGSVSSGIGAIISALLGK